jgi:hypothetical protein
MAGTRNDRRKNEANKELIINVHACPGLRTLANRRIDEVESKYNLDRTTNSFSRCMAPKWRRIQEMNIGDAKTYWSIPCPTVADEKSLCMAFSDPSMVTTRIS